MTVAEALPVSAAPLAKLPGWLTRRPRLVLALFCIALWLPGILSLPPLDRDESRYAQASRQMLESGNYVDIRFGAEPRYKKPIAIYWLQSATTALAGEGDHSRIWTYRLASLLGGLAGVWLTFWCAGAILSRDGAFLAALLMGSSVLLTGESTIATTDAVQIGCLIGALGVMLRVYRAARGPDALPPPTLTVMAGWTAFAAGILVKGFVVPAVAAVTVIALLAWDRKAGWLKGLKPLVGILWTLLLVAPWLIAITLTSHGAFFAESVGHDFGAKLVSGQETHGMPPGYYLLLSSLTFWPAILFVAPAIGNAIAGRADPAIRFLLAWAGASWAMFEAVPTKLPHYVLPAYPALAILTALWLTQPRTAPAAGAAFWPRLLGWIGGIQFVLGAGAVAAALTLGPALLPQLYLEGDPWWIKALAGTGAALALIALILAMRGAPLRALAVSLASLFVLVPTLTAGAGPRLDKLWVSQRLRPLVEDNFRPGDPPPVAAGFTEPSLVFALGADTRLTDGAGAAALGTKGGGLALIEGRERGAFLAGLAEREADATEVATMSGFNYSRGKPVTISVFRVAKVRDTPQ